MRLSKLKMDSDPLHRGESSGPELERGLRLRPTWAAFCVPSQDSICYNQLAVK